MWTGGTVGKGTHCIEQVFCYQWIENSFKNKLQRNVTNKYTRAS